MAEFFMDEAVRETVQPAGGAVFNLLGPVSGRQPFSSAKRFNGDDIENGDLTTVTVVQEVGGAKLRVNALATVTLGGTNTLTLNQTPHPAGFMYFSTEGDSFPGFNTGDTGEAFCAGSVPNFAIFDHLGNLLQKALFRQNLSPADLAAFLAQAALSENEAVFHLGRNGASYTGLAGLIAHNSGLSGTADNIDKFNNPNSGGGRQFRVPMKVTPTIREITIGAGGVANIASYAPWLDLTIPDAEYLIGAGKVGDLDARLRGYWRGHATAPEPDWISQSVNGLLAFDLDGTDLRLKNKSGASGSYWLTVERTA